MAAIVINVAGSYDNKALTQAQRDLEKLKRQGDAASAGLSGAFATVGSKLKQVGANVSRAGRKLSMFVTAPVVGLGIAAVRMANDFESSMAKIEGLVGVPADELAAMKGAVAELASQFGFSAGEAADALFYITSAGLRGQDAMDVLAASLQGAAVGLGDVKTIADLATSAMNAYGSDILSATDATDVLTAAVREGKLEASDLAGSMGRVLPIASAMGVEFDEVGAAFAAMSRTGTNAEEASTQLKGILAGLLKPTVQAKKALKDMGLSAGGLRKQLAEEGLLATLETLSTKFDGNQAAAAKVFPNIRALSGVLDLMGSNVSTTVDIFGNMEDATGSLNTAFQATEKTGAFQLDQAMSTFKNTLMEIGQIIAPVVTEIANAFKGLVDQFRALDPNTQRTIVIVAAVAAAMGPLLMILGSVITAVGALSGALSFLAANPVVLAIIAIVAAIAALVIGMKYAYENFEWFRNAWDTVWGAIEQTVAVVVDWFMDNAWPAIQTVFGYIKDALSVLFEAYKTYWTFIFGIVSKVVGWFMEHVWPVLQSVFGFIGTILGILWEAFSLYWGLVWDILKKVMAWFVANVWPQIQKAFSGIMAALTPLWNAFRTYFTFIWDLLTKVVSWIENTALPFVKRGFDGMSLAARALWDAIKVAFDLIRGHILKAVDIILATLTGIGKIVATVVGFFNSIREGIIDKFRAAVDFVRQIPAKILAALGGVVTTLWSAGSDLIGGLIEGIKARAGEVISTIKSWITDKIPTFVKDALGIGSPSKVMMDIGKWIPIGLAKGIEKAEQAVRDAARKLAEATTDEAKKTAKDALRDAQQAAKELARRTAQTIKESAVAGLEKVKDKAREVLDYVRGIRDDIRAFGGVTNLNLGDGAITATAIASQMRSRLAQAQTFAAAVTQLRNLGLNNASLQEIISAGPESGTQIAQALAAGGQSAVAEVNQLEAALASVGSFIGDVGARSQFDMSRRSAEAIMGTGVRVERGAVVINFGEGIASKDAAEIREEIRRAVQAGLADLAREIRSS